MNPLPYDMLFAFVTMAEAGSMTAAASKLGISQPALSKKLSKLQHALPHELFVSQGARKVLSPYGEALRARIMGPMTEFQASLNEVNLYFEDAAQMHLRIGARREVINRFARDFRFAGTLQLQPMSRERSLDCLKKRELDGAIVQELPEAGDFHGWQLGRNSLTLAAHQSLCPEPLAISAKDETWLLHTPAIAYKNSLPFLAEWFAHLQVSPPRPKMVVEDWHAIADLVADGQGYAILPADIPLTAKKVMIEPIAASIITPVPFFFVVHQSLASVPAIRELGERLSQGSDA